MQPAALFFLSQQLLSQKNITRVKVSTHTPSRLTTPKLQCIHGRRQRMLKGNSNLRASLVVSTLSLLRWFGRWLANAKGAP